MELIRNQRRTKNNYDHIQDSSVDRVNITCFTDPLCCWSWAFEPQWRRLQYEFGDKISFQYCMGGLLPGWKNFYDAANAVSRPIQMGPIWMHAAQLSGMPMQPNIWMTDPPSSSFPACIAVKAVMLQSEQFGDRYLRLLREAIMLNGNNISRQDVLVEVAVNLKQEFESFNLEVFKEDLHNDKALEAFRIDLQQVRNYDINRLPTLIIRRPQQPSKIIKGYRPYNVLLDVLEKISPGISKIRQAETAEQYAEYWKGILPRELEEAVGSHK